MNIADHVQSWVIKILGFSLRRFSLRRVRKMAASVGRFFYRYIPVRRDVALANLGLCFPDKSRDELEKILAGCYVNVATVLFEFLYFPKFTKESLHKVTEFSESTRSLVESALERGKGLIMIGGHFSNWELIAFSVGAFSPKRILAIVHPLHNKPVDGLTDKYRQLLGNKTVPMANSIRASISELRSNGIVGLLADQSPAKESAPARFFGIDVPTFQGPASFALRTGAALLVGGLIRKDDGSYRIELREIDYSDLKDESEESVRELTQRHVAILEDYVRRYPEWWLWFHKRFKHLQVFQEKLREIKET